MSESKRPPINYTRRRIGVGLAATALTLLGAKGVDMVQDARDNSKQPYCEVPVKYGDTVSGVASRLGHAGDRGDTMRVLNPDGERRDTLYAGEAGVPTLNAMQPGDTIEVSNVDPAVCQDIGGTVLQDVDRVK